eukprot:scaffold239573_cov28-Tisochrysis_lutea.AAC.3
MSFGGALQTPSSMTASVLFAAACAAATAVVTCAATSAGRLGDGAAEGICALGVRRVLGLARARRLPGPPRDASGAPMAHIPRLGRNGREGRSWSCPLPTQPPPPQSAHHRAAALQPDSSAGARPPPPVIVHVSTLPPPSLRDLRPLAPR